MYLEVDGTVFSYGRYDGSYSPSSGAFGPVGNGFFSREIIPMLSSGRKNILHLFINSLMPMQVQFINT